LRAVAAEEVMSEKEKKGQRKSLPKETPPAEPVKKPLLLPRYDNIFKKIFGDKDNVDILRSLLSAVLDMPAKSFKTITIEDPNLRIEDGQANKSPVLDLKLTLADGTGIDLELQVEAVAAMKKRVIFCTSKLVTEQLGAGKDYNTIHRVVTVVISYFDLTKNPSGYHHRFFLYDKKYDALFTNLFEIDIVELGKLPKADDKSPLWTWAEFFRVKTEEEFDMLAEKNVEVEKAVAIIKRLSGDERERRLAEKRELARMDMAVNLSGAYNEGVERGIEQGVEKTARAALIKGFSIADVAAITGLDEEFVKNLKAAISL
jgi:predicted transposase/invertase (TIGR01784 family)